MFRITEVKLIGFTSILYLHVIIIFAIGVSFDGTTSLNDVVERVRLAEEEAVINDIPFDYLLSELFPADDESADKCAALFQVDPTLVY